MAMTGSDGDGGCIGSLINLTLSSSKCAYSIDLSTDAKLVSWYLAFSGCGLDILQPSADILHDSTVEALSTCLSALYEISRVEIHAGEGLGDVGSTE